MKKIFSNNIFLEIVLVCLIVVLVISLFFITDKTKEEQVFLLPAPALPTPVIIPVPIPVPPVFVSPEQERGRILNVIEDKGTWTIKLNESAVYSVNHKGVKVRLNIGYCTYENDKVNNNAVEIKPEWHPPLEESRITAGLWIPYRYLSSILIKWTKVKSEQIAIIASPTVKEEITPEEEFKGIERQPKPKEFIWQPEAGKSADSLLEVWK